MNRLGPYHFSPPERLRRVDRARCKTRACLRTVDPSAPRLNSSFRSTNTGTPMSYIQFLIKLLSDRDRRLHDPYRLTIPLCQLEAEELYANRHPVAEAVVRAHLPNRAVV